MVFRSTSSLLLVDGKPGELRECPVGFVLRECPQVYDAIAAHSYADNGCFNPIDSPLWLQEMVRVAGSERARHSEAKETSDRGRRDADMGARALSRG